MFPRTMQDPEYTDEKGGRKDGQNLVEEWAKNKKVNAFARKFLFSHFSGLFTVHEHHF